MENDVGRNGVFLRALEAPAAQSRDELLVHVDGAARPDPRWLDRAVGVQDPEAVGGRHLDERARAFDELHPSANVGVGGAGEHPVRGGAARRRRRFQRAAQRGDEAPSSERPRERCDRVDDRLADVIGQRRRRARDRCGHRASTATHTSQAPHGPAKSSPKCAATCSCRQTRVSAKAITGRRATRRRAWRDREALRPARARRSGAVGTSIRIRRPSSKSAANETGLLEHPDENASVSFGHQRGEIVRLDEPVGVAQRAVDGTELRRRSARPTPRTVAMPSRRSGWRAGASRSARRRVRRDRPSARTPRASPGS